VRSRASTSLRASQPLRSVSPHPAPNAARRYPVAALCAVVIVFSFARADCAEVGGDVVSALGVGAASAEGSWGLAVGAESVVGESSGRAAESPGVSKPPPAAGTPSVTYSRAEVRKMTNGASTETAAERARGALPIRSPNLPERRAERGERN